MNTFGLISSIIVSFIAMESSAIAGTATFDYNGYTVSNNTNVYIDATLAANSTLSTIGWFGSGQITLYGSGTSSGKTLAAWCIDAFDDLASSGAYKAIASGFLNQGTTGSPISETTLGQIGALVKYGNANINTAYVSPAVQIAIWDLEYQGLLTSKTPFVSSDANVNAEVATLLSDIQNKTLASYSNLGEVIATNNQGLIFDLAGASISPVPLPGALPLFGTAFMGLAGFGMRKRRRTKIA
ncbi:MAG TPA: PEP-CTERM sorting domain-containing protein [Telmatospirillum sp.]|nr:PEP-CTERM sorting domain-containing protein [Telmatospirillum sp.]